MCIPMQPRFSNMCIQENRNFLHITLQNKTRVSNILNKVSSMEVWGWRVWPTMSSVLILSQIHQFILTEHKKKCSEVISNSRWNFNKVVCYISSPGNKLKYVLLQLLLGILSCRCKPLIFLTRWEVPGSTQMCLKTFYPLSLVLYCSLI